MALAMGSPSVADRDRFAMTTSLGAYQGESAARVSMVGRVGRRALFVAGVVKAMLSGGAGGRVGLQFKR